MVAAAGQSMTVYNRIAYIALRRSNHRSAVDSRLTQIDVTVVKNREIKMSQNKKYLTAYVSSICTASEPRRHK